MKVNWTPKLLQHLRTDVVAIPFVQKGVNPAFDVLNGLVSGGLKVAAEQETFKGQKGRTLTWQGQLNGGHKYICVFGLGEPPILPTTWRNAIGRAQRFASRHRQNSLGIFTDSRDRDDQIEQVRLTAEALQLADYRFDQYLAKPSPKFPKEGKIGIFPKAADLNACRTAIKEGNAIAKGVILARDLVNEPANQLSPLALADRARKMAVEQGLECSILDKNKLQRQRMNLLLAVAAGSTRKPCLIHLVYRPAEKNAKKIVLVGKGLTFDAGGLCLKPAKSMTDMKTDMAGAATVIGAMAALPVLRPQVEVHGIIPATDNTITGDAMRPGDILQSAANISVEIINTDAEGRLILADALTYAQKLNPQLIIDHATLTGACVVALGQYTAGLFTNNEPVARAYLAAAERAGESFWPLPLTDELNASIRSDVADVKNTGGRYGGAITAALFLKRFINKNKWVHIDLAGPGRSEKNTPLCPRGGSGFGVLTACEYLKNC